jgi:diaminopimelate epimerase
MAQQYFVKDPNAVLDYKIDWTTWLSTDTIATATWTVPAGITQASATNTTTAATIWLSGGTAGTTYEVVCRVVTSGGRTDDRTIGIRVEDK